MNRVMIVGQPGGGKSTLARMVGARLDLPVIHVDLIHWLPGWQERPKEEKIAMALEVQAREKWVFEGGLSATHGDRLKRADMLVVLDMPFLLRVWRVFWRTISQYGKTRPDLPENCPERFDAEFWTWIWNTRNSARDANLRKADRARQMGKEVVILRSRAEVNAWIAALGNDESE